MIRLIASTVPSGDTSPLVAPQKQWQQRTAGQPLPGRLAFLVFEIDCEYELSEFLVGLHDVPTETGYIVAGTVSDFQATIETDQDLPHDVVQIYEFFRQKLRDFGY